MKIEIKETGSFIEYKNYFFADIYDMYFNGKLVGQKMVDKGIKIWYAIFFNSKNESEIKLPEGCNFGEDVIYTHDIKQVEELLELINNIRV
jgi:hypothetical protein